MLSFLFQLISYAEAERVDICNRQTFSQESGTACTFDTIPGEDIKVWVRYRDSSPHSVRVWIDPYTSNNSITVNANHSDTLTRHVSAGQGRNANVRFFINNFAPNDDDFVDIEVYRERSNLTVFTPSINSSTGELSVRWGVTTQSRFTPEDYISVNLWGNENEYGYEQSLGRWWLSACANRGNCYSTVRVPLENRVPIERGKTWLTARIDHESRHPETDEWDNVTTYNMGDFIVEEIPSIMLAYSTTWALPSILLNRWLNEGIKQKSTNITGIDWNLRVVRSVSTSWFLDPQHAANSRIIDKFNELISREKLTTERAKDVLTNKINHLFAQNPRLNTVPLSQHWNSGIQIQDYHEQQFQLIQVQSGGLSIEARLDAVTAAFAGFSFFAVPFGTASKENPHSYLVTLDSVAVHVLDSFDFNGRQFLACWGSPDRIWPIWLPNLTCVYNSDLRNYRNIKARGLDYNVFTTPITVRFSQPIIYHLPH